MLQCHLPGWGTAAMRFAGIYSVNGFQTVYHGCCLTQRNVKVWKPKQMRIWVSTENSRGPEIRPEGGRRDTSSFHAGFRLTEQEQVGSKNTDLIKQEPQPQSKAPQRALSLFQRLLVKTMRRMMAISMKRNWKSPRLLRI